MARRFLLMATIKEVSEKYKISPDTLRYYERVGMIPTVTRKSNGVRDYQKDDLGWVELAICMRSAGLPIEAMIEYVRLFQEGDHTMEARLHLLSEQREILLDQQRQIQETRSEEHTSELQSRQYLVCRLLLE